MSEDSGIQAEIIAVGSELLTPFRSETNSLFLTGKLNQLGIVVRRKTVVGDDEQLIAQAILSSLARAQIVMLTGGLGPTADDLTREGVCAALGLDLALDSSVLAHLEDLYERFGFRMAENNRRQAQVPSGASVIANPRGTAPGLFLKRDGKLIFLLPGPPRELQPMVAKDVMPLIRGNVSTHERPFRQVRVASMAESAVDAQVEPIYKAFGEVETTILSSLGIIDLFFHWRGADNSKAEESLEELCSAVREKLGDAVFAEGPEELESVVGAMLRRRGLHLATAESCTGGILAKLVTDIPGSSDYYLGGVVSYANSLKTRWLDVPEEVLAESGAVSETVAAQMARGICRQTGAEVGLSLTGIAGPGGGGPDKPVGTVFIGLFEGGEPLVKKRRFPGDRHAVRVRSARLALDLLRRHLS